MLEWIFEILRHTVARLYQLRALGIGHCTRLRSFLTRMKGVRSFVRSFPLEITRQTDSTSWREEGARAAYVTLHTGSRGAIHDADRLKTW